MRALPDLELSDLCIGEMMEFLDELNEWGPLRLDPQVPPDSRAFFLLLFLLLFFLFLLLELPRRLFSIVPRLPIAFGIGSARVGHVRT